MRQTARPDECATADPVEGRWLRAAKGVAGPEGSGHGSSRLELMFFRRLCYPTFRLRFRFRFRLFRTRTVTETTDGSTQATN